MMLSDHHRSALRNAMSIRLEARWGDEWFANREMPLDDRSLAALNTAWRRVNGPRTPGRIVAQCCSDSGVGCSTRAIMPERNRDVFGATTRCSGEGFSTGRFLVDGHRPGEMVVDGTANTRSPS
jgi:hypothetical protein